MLNESGINEIFSRLAKLIPQPQIELDYVNSYTLLVAVILSAQSTDKGVNKATKALFMVAKTPYEMVQLGEIALKQYIKSIGLFNSKARNIIAMSKALIEQFAGQVPDNAVALESLAGVGRKSANVILNSVFKQPTIAVDTHVFRVSNRIGLCKTKTPLATEQALVKIIPNQWKRYAHHWLVLHGRYTCQAKKPRCGSCTINDICLFKDKTELLI